VPDPFDLSSLLRRIRRTADMSQRELAEAAQMSAAAVAHAEAGSRDLPVAALVRAAEVAGLHLALLDADGREVRGMHPDAVRDRGGRHFPAHLDTVLSEERSSRWEHQPNRPQPTYTFDRRRPWDDPAARTTGRPDDHRLPQPGDSPAEQRAAAQAAARARRQEERARRIAAGEIGPVENWTCTCPPLCDELDDREGPPVHAPNCPCGCDVA
jgi:transcriptional regulator with XRE-family HTH domain